MDPLSFEPLRAMAAGLVYFLLSGVVWVAVTVKVMNHRKHKKSRVNLPSNWNAKKLRAEQ